MEEQVPVPPPTKKFPILPVLLSFLIILLGATAYLAYQYEKLQTRATTPLNTAPSPTPKTQSNLSAADLVSQIKYGDTIDTIKTVNTNNWKAVSGTAIVNKSLNYSFQYPENLYVVPNIRPGIDKLYFFADKDAYNKYVTCIQDKTPRQGGGGPTRDWESGCDGEGNLLFTVSVDFSDGRNATYNNKPGDLTRYAGWGDQIKWFVPKKDAMFVGLSLSYYADGDTPKGWITLYLTPASETQIKSITGIDSYTLFTHIVASFQVKS